MVNNGNRYITDLDGVNNDFGRDIDKLLTKFKNLRWSLYHRYSGSLRNDVEREELKEYIDEQFIKLVKEYDIHSKVNFPGYIKTKLTLRVQNSYIKKEDKYRRIEMLGKKEGTIEALIETSDGTSIQDNELVNFVFDGVEFTEIQSELLKELITNTERSEDSYIISKVANTLGVERSEVVSELTEVRDYVRFKVKNYYSTTKNYMPKGRVNTDNDIWD